ncbi:hypothetical protein SHJG_8436 [Streptomyces hygroscopicus subsp. jinggangensis 5008]|nr:hypothetical protein SHJG_8436 [Streptomyces hygroscopicus subsp. jinggangensis 5008]AGF67859.1 hypothetical protein SHJGH_8197 [Streptomyces hygroscopicus subsp. jinggangensis TL01]
MTSRQGRTRRAAGTPGRRPGAVAAERAPARRTRGTGPYDRPGGLPGRRAPAHPCTWRLRLAFRPDGGQAFVVRPPGRYRTSGLPVVGPAPVLAWQRHAKPPAFAPTTRDLGWCRVGRGRAAAPRPAAGRRDAEAPRVQDDLKAALVPPLPVQAEGAMLFGHGLARGHLPAPVHWPHLRSAGPGAVSTGARRLWTRTVDHGGVGPVPEGLDEGSVSR